MSPTAPRHLFPGASLYRPLLARLDAMFGTHGAGKAYGAATTELMKLADRLALATPPDEADVVDLEASGHQWTVSYVHDADDGPVVDKFWTGCTLVSIDDFLPASVCYELQDALMRHLQGLADDVAIDAAQARRDDLGGAFKPSIAAFDALTVRAAA